MEVETPCRGCVRIRTLLAVFGVLAALGLAQAAAAQTLTVRYAQAFSSARSIFSLPISIAQREGLFAREGLRVDIVIPVPGGSDKMIAALDDNWADLTHVATPFLIRAAMRGSDAVAIDSEFNNPVYSLVAKPAISGYANLKDKQIGLADELGTITLSMRKLWRRTGWRAEAMSRKSRRGPRNAPIVSSTAIAMRRCLGSLRISRPWRPDTGSSAAPTRWCRNCFTP